MNPQFPHVSRYANVSRIIVVAAMLLLLPTMSFAQTTGFSLPFITGIGCDIVRWMKGELAVMIFVIVAIATFLIGLFAKMDWTKILSIVIIYGLLQGLIGILLSTNTIQVPSCFN
jgi:type IV secretory pathway VirB2 component (pilin)